MWINQEDPQDPYNRAQNNSSANVGAGGGSAAPSANSTGSNTAQGNPSTITPSGPTPPTQQFATIQDYLGANKQQGEQLGQKVTGALSDTYNTEKGNIDTSAQNAQNEVNAGSVNYNSDLANSVTKNPSDLTNNADKFAQLQKQWNASYSGPSSFQNSDQYSNASEAANEANTKAQELGTTGGREQLLQDQFNVYGQGNKGLDTSILQSSSYFPQLQQQQGQFQSVQDYLNNQANTVNNTIPAAQTNTQQAQDLTRSTINQNIANLGNTVNAEKNAIQTTGASNPNNSAANFLALLPANPTDFDLQKVGINRDQYNAIVANSGMQNTPGITNSLYAQNPQYSQDLASYLAAQKLQQQLLQSQI